MVRTGVVYVLVVATIAMFLASAGSAGVTASVPGEASAHSSATAPAASPIAGSATSSAVASSAPAAREQSILSELHGSGIPQSDIHLPDLSVAAPYAGEQVAPTYSSAPAPMGVADLGLTNVSGKLVGSVLDTSSVEGTITLNNALSVNVDGDGPDMFGIQLNAVVTGITLFGNSSEQFWMQNFVSYTPSSGELVFGDNVWNFSNYDAYISPNVFYATGPNGTLYAPVYYYAIGPTFTIHYPFTITFYENSTVLLDRPAVFFNYTVSNSTLRTSGSYDYVVFNATAGTPKKAFPAGRFQINGKTIDPVGLPNDLELDVVGNDDGDTTTFYQMDATLSIATWDSLTKTYVPVRSAMDAGSETGETSDGVDVSYAGSVPVATMRLGPSFLYGLWGESSDSGARKVVQTLDPATTFIFVNPGATQDRSAEQWVMSSPTGSTTFYVPNGGTYWVEYLLSDRDPGHALLTGAANSTTALSFSGTLNLAEGVYTPLIAFGNAELASISSGGSGSVADPYVLYNNELGPIDPQFAAWNDYQFPVFPGVLLIGTTAYVTVTPPSFQIEYPSWMAPTIEEFGLPSSNDLQLQFWETTHVRVLGGTISGWLSAFLEGFPEGSVMFWNSSNDLVAGSTFTDEGDAIVLYGGSSNTLWGNSFFFKAVAASDPADVLNYGPLTQAINESESGDLIYNNYVDVPFPAITPTYDPLSCQILCESATYLDRWNVSLQPATDVKVVDGIDLSGSILGLKTEGGNYWSNYGSQADPYGVLPYNNSGNIAYGGDYLPLEPFVLHYVVFTESGLPVGTPWAVTLGGITESSTGRTITFADPAGSYLYRVAAVPGYVASPTHGSVDLNKGPVSISIHFIRDWWPDLPAPFGEAAVARN
jgi:thermopsin